MIWMEYKLKKIKFIFIFNSRRPLVLKSKHKKVEHGLVAGLEMLTLCMEQEIPLAKSVCLPLQLNGVNYHISGGFPKPGHATTPNS